MKKIIRFTALLCVAVIMLSTAVAAAELPDMQGSEKTVVSASAYFGDIYRFIEVNGTPDLTKGYVDFTFDDGTQEHVLLNDERMTPFPDTSDIGYLPYTFEIYGYTYTVNFIVLNPDVDMSKFTDIAKSYWGYIKIRNVLSAGFFTGMSENTFEPRGNMTRAQFCQMIYNIYKNDPNVMTSDIEIRFSDVENGRWYYDAVMACAEAGIVNGVGDGLFCPSEPIKRQDAAVIMMRILLGADALDNVDVDSALVKAREKGIAAGDFGTTSNYAKKAVAAALGVIFFGDADGNLTPKNYITRAECASMMSNYFFDGYIEPPIKYLVYLSPENRTYNTYAGMDTNESEQMYLLAANVTERLRALGYDVFIADINTSIKEDSEFNRADEAAQMGADAYVALHTNALGRTNNGEDKGGAGGATCFYNGNNTGARELSQFIYDRLSALTPTNDNGIHDDIYESMVNNQTPYAEVRLPTMANLILEVEFHDYKPYAEWIVNNIDGIGECFALGIDDYFKSL